MSFSVHVDNKKKYISILGEGLTQGVDDSALTAGKKIQSILLRIIQSLFEFTL